MADRFDYFVILAGMRTGSNFLEASLNRYEGLSCLGELFNPAFVGHANQSSLFGMDASHVAAEPLKMIEHIRSQDGGIAGFRLFRDHNDAALAHVLSDPRCAKIMLRRNPVDSFVSLQIVQKTGQWRLADMKNAKSAKVEFDAAAFASYLSAVRGHFDVCTHALQSTGQAAFVIDYDQLGDVDVINGLARFLGCPEALDAVTQSTKKQNPEPLSEKVTNYAEMVAEVAALDPLSLMHDPSFEPSRGAIVGQYRACSALPLLYLPIKCAGVDKVTQWLADVSEGADVLSGFSQKSLRQWKRQHKGHTTFTVVRHPVLRAFEAYVTHLLELGDNFYAGIHDTLSGRYGLPLPKSAALGDVSDQALKQGFLAFLGFVKGNLAGQTSIRVDGAWASQSEIVKGFAQFALPDRIIREERLPEEFADLARRLGVKAPDCQMDGPLRTRLARIYDSDIEKAARAAYQKDYMQFGFEAWAD